MTNWILLTTSLPSLNTPQLVTDGEKVNIATRVLYLFRDWVWIVHYENRFEWELYYEPTHYIPIPPLPR